MKENGFTLIELLAVIIILSIVALIAVPTVTNLIENSKISAAKASAQSVIKAAKVYYNNEQIDGNSFAGAKFKCDGISCKKCVDSDCTSYENIILTIEGNVPDDGIIEISSIGNVYITSVLGFDGNKIYVGYDVNGNIEGSRTKAEVTRGSAVPKTSFSIGKQLMFDPVNNAVCSSGNTCYTWNIVSNNSTTIDIMMRENLNSTVMWDVSVCNEDNGYYTCTSNNEPYDAYDYLASQTSNWNVTNIRIISAEEIYAIIGGEGDLSYMWFGTSTSEEYNWLRPVSGHTYWTITGINPSEDETAYSSVWCVGESGNISTFGYIGQCRRWSLEFIRPVITVEKEMF